MPGQRLKVDGEWRTEGETVEITDAYQAQVLIVADVAAPAAAAAKAEKGS